MITLADVKKAQENLKGVSRKTPLFVSSTFSKQTGYEVYLKCENKQKTGSFKLRGAYNKVASLTEEEKAKGVVASSAGNHAQGVAYAATAFGIKSTICMPVTAPLAKVQATKNYGATVIQHGEVYDDCYAKAVEVQKETGATFLHPFDDEQVMAGQGTIALEILEDLPDADAILVPIGGGGIIAGIAVAAKSINPNIKIIGVQADVIASSKASLEKGEVVTVDGPKSLADGISVKTPGNKTFEVIKKYVDEIVTVTEDEIASGIFSLMERNKVVAEGAGAVGLAALLSGKVKNAGKKVVAVVSGGNIDIATVSKIIDRQLLLNKRRITLQIELKDKIGELGNLISEIASLGGNVYKVKQDKNWNPKGLEISSIEIEVETESKDHAEMIKTALSAKGYAVEELTK
ncbi:threonine ammonia-lyase [Clostridium senegalense]|uniref:threonine ammonia-lyase n=1 Tax=Clostridium senegalense TaxID=1465809 RepID=UPI001C0FE77C|nr:threonine ammonia-lyase [Clostridium senegalense]MBU5226949.1 threonine ammonia-lyase [Clostridium senegalense]